MRIILVCLLLLGACSSRSEPPAVGDKASSFRTNFAASALAACKRRLAGLGFPQDEIDFACPCMVDHMLTHAPNDADLNSEAIRAQAIETCAAQADARFPAPQG